MVKSNRVEVIGQHQRGGSPSLLQINTQHKARQTLADVPYKSLIPSTLLASVLFLVYVLTVPHMQRGQPGDNNPHSNKNVVTTRYGSTIDGMHVCGVDVERGISTLASLHIGPDQCEEFRGGARVWRCMDDEDDEMCLFDPACADVVEQLDKHGLRHGNSVNNCARRLVTDPMGPSTLGSLVRNTLKRVDRNYTYVSYTCGESAREIFRYINSASINLWDCVEYGGSRAVFWRCAREDVDIWESNRERCLAILSSFNRRGRRSLAEIPYAEVDLWMFAGTDYFIPHTHTRYVETRIDDNSLYGLAMSSYSTDMGCARSRDGRPYIRARGGASGWVRYRIRAPTSEREVVNTHVHDLRRGTLATRMDWDFKGVPSSEECYVYTHDAWFYFTPQVDGRSCRVQLYSRGTLGDVSWGMRTRDIALIRDDNTCRDRDDASRHFSCDAYASCTRQRIVYPPQSGQVHV